MFGSGIKCLAGWSGAGNLLATRNFQFDPPRAGPYAPGAALGGSVVRLIRPIQSTQESVAGVLLLVGGGRGSRDSGTAKQKARGQATTQNGAKKEGQPAAKRRDGLFACCFFSLGFRWLFLVVFVAVTLAVVGGGRFHLLARRTAAARLAALAAPLLSCCAVWFN